MTHSLSLHQHIYGLTKKLSFIVIAAVALVFAGGLFIANHRSAQPARHSRSLTATDRSIATTSKQLTLSPKSASLMITLCQDYLQKVRETADSSYYATCDDLLKRAQATAPDNPDVIATQASLAYGRHDFSAGLALAQKALSLNPDHAGYYGLVGDGQIELGAYDDAIASFQSMVTRRPDLSSYNRVAYIREIYGDTSGAESALASAVSAGSSFPENIAYSQVELGKLYARTDLGRAEASYRQALYTLKDYPPALEGLGKIAYARRDYASAVDYFSKASATLPLAQYANDLADTYAAQGNSAKASQQYYVADLAFDAASNGGVNNDFEKAVYLTDHGRELKTTNTLARKAVAARPNIFSYDGLAWNLYKLGNYMEAEANITTALVAGSREPVVLYHAGMIAAKLGHTDDARMYLQQSRAADHYFLESHFSLLDKQLGDKVLADL